MSLELAPAMADMAAAASHYLGPGITPPITSAAQAFENMCNAPFRRRVSFK
jgi:hypothetical protein